MSRISIIVVAVVLLTTSCNKDSNELPLPPLPIRKEVKKNVAIDGKDVLEVIIQPPRHVGDEPTMVSLRNISGSDINDASVTIEVCEGKQNYEACKRYQLFEVLNLKRGARSGLGRLEGLTITDQTVFNVFLSKYENRGFVLGKSMASDSSSMLNGFVTFFKDDEIAAYGKSNAYVQADGTTLIRLSSFDVNEGVSKYYNVTGRIVRDTLLIGTLATDLAPASIVPLLTGSTFLRPYSMIKMKEDYEPFNSIQITHQ